jgi:hypothetical protein
MKNNSKNEYDEDVITTDIIDQFENLNNTSSLNSVVPID